MRLVVVHGSPRKGGNTFAATRRFVEEMRKLGTVETTEFFAAEALPKLCQGCASCVLKGEDTCPHAEGTLPILRAMLAADALLFTTPIFVLAEGGAIKNFLDHFCYLFLVHRAQPEMFRKKALVLCTTLGAGTRRAMGTVAVSLRFWGVNRVRKLALPMRMMSWAQVEPKRRARLDGKLQKAAAAFYQEVDGGKRHRPYAFLYVMYAFVRHMMTHDISKHGADSLDLQHWQRLGWLEKRPF
jgi:multimeric flavodoxin WrbA